MSAPPFAQHIGRLAEQYALLYLQQQGLELCERNFHCRYGEIDLIMREQHCLVFVEVRARSRAAWLSALETIDLQKQRKIVRTAEYYLQNYADYADSDCRFDVIAIDYDGREAVLSNAIQRQDFESTAIGLQWIKNADLV